MNEDSLADRLIKANELAEQGKDIDIPYPNIWGVDDRGFHWPNPVNAQAVAAAVFFWHGRVDGLDNIFRVGDDVFIGRKKVSKSKNDLLMLFDSPKIVIWANPKPELQDPDKLWRQIKRIISSEYPIVWNFVARIAPEYNKDYIRITKGLVWGKDEADILFM